MSRIEAIGESRIKRDVGTPPPCGLFRRGVSESLVWLEEFARTRGRFGGFSRARARIAACALVILLAGVPAMPRAGPAAGPQAGEHGNLRRQAWLVPSPQPGVLMRTTVFRPPGSGPFPLMVMNHGTTQNAERRRTMPAPVFASLSQWFVRRGYVVALPERPGHGETGGLYGEDQGGCDDADFSRAGRAAAASIAAAIAYLRAQPFVRRTGAIVAGQSAGGWAALALASRAPAGVSAAIDFAGGLGGRSYDRPDNNCAPDRLVAAAAEFGRTARIPTLWVYSENDSYFAPRLSGAMAAAFRAAGGKVEYQLLPPFGDDGHYMAETEGSEAVWGPAVERFLATLR
jgi:dienelactone hydrolase